MNNWIVWLLQFIIPRRYWYRKLYLRSRHWRGKTQQAKQHHGYYCAKCGATEYLHTHHLTYKRIWRENMNDLQVLCRTCHNKEHERKTTK
jgi:5-methylcytosine-specific restriction endonuclease McrA